MRSPARKLSRGIISSRRTTPSALPRSTTTEPNSERLTTPCTTSPMRSLYSSYWRSRSASRTFCTITCLAFWALMRLKSTGGRVSAMMSPIWASGLRLRASARLNLGLVVLDQLHDMQIARDMGLAGLGIDIDLDVVLGAVMGLGGALHRLFHRGQHHLLVDGLVARDGVGDLQKFEPVGGYGTCHFTSPVALVRFARLQIFVDELVGEHEFGVGDGAKRKLDVVIADAASRITTSWPSSPSSVARKRLRPVACRGAIEFDLGLVAGPAREIHRPGQRPVDAGRGDFDLIFAFDRVFRLDEIQQRMARAWRSLPHPCCRRGARPSPARSWRRRPSCAGAPA